MNGSTPEDRFALYSEIDGAFLLRYATPRSVRVVMGATLDLIPGAKFSVYREDGAPPAGEPIAPAWLDKPLGQFDLRAAAATPAEGSAAAGDSRRCAAPATGATKVALGDADRSLRN